MPGVQLNYEYYTYESDDATTYNIRASQEWAGHAAHDLAPRTSGAPRFISSKQQKPRSATYRDTTTGRSNSGPVGTASAYAALTIGDTITVSVPGLATAVTYTLTKKTGERVPTTISVGHLADHA